MKLNLAAGRKLIPGYKSVGYEDHHDFKADIRDLSQFDEGSIDAIMAIHCIEHVERWEVPDMLAGWLRILKRGGTVAIECPDLIKCCRNIIKGLPRQEGIQGLFGEWELRDPLMGHKHAYSTFEMQEILGAAGFTAVRFVVPHYHGRREHRDMRAEAVKP